MPRETRHHGQGYEGNYGNLRPTAFRKKLEEDPLGKKTMELQSMKLPPKKVKDATEKIPPPPEGYERPTTWLQVAQAPAVLIATHEGWEPCTHELKIGKDKKGKLFVTGKQGSFCWRGSWLEDVSLKSLRVPGAGERELRHG